MIGLKLTVNDNDFHSSKMFKKIKKELTLNF